MRRPRQARSRCARGREWISLELDGELPELGRVLLAAHLAYCASCRSFARTLACLTDELRRHPLERPSRPLAPAAVRRPRVTIAPVAALAAAAVASIVLGLASAAGTGAPAPTGGQIAMPPVQSSLLVALRDEQSHSARRFRYAVQRRPQTQWWRDVYGGKPVAS